MKRTFYKMFFLAFLLTALFTTHAYAMDNIEYFDDETPTKDITFTANVPDGFDERIEIYLNGAPLALSYSEGYPMNGYTMTIPVNEGIYSVVVLSSTDLSDRYIFQAPETLDTGKTTEYIIEVSEDESVLSEEFDDHEHLSDESVEEIILEPAYYDYADGKEAGEFRVSCHFYPALQSVTYCLNGENIYEIVLDRDHYFEAVVKLPVGSYYETSIKDVMLDEDAILPEGFSLQFAHDDNPGFWGNYYDITSNNSVSVTDLIILMVNGANTTELDSNLLFQKTYSQNYYDNMMEHQRKEMEEAMPEYYSPEQSETETIAEAQPVEETNPINWKQIGIIIFMIIIAASLVYMEVVFIIKRKKD